MTDEELAAVPGKRRRRRRHTFWDDRRPAPPGYGWQIKMTLAIALLLVSISFFLLIIYLVPTSKSNADAAHDAAETARNLAQATAEEKAQDACYDRYQAVVSDKNAATIASVVDQQSAQGRLFVVAVAVPRDQAKIDDAIRRIDATRLRAEATSGEYNAAVAARNNYVAGGRPLPCPAGG